MSTERIHGKNLMSAGEQIGKQNVDSLTPVQAADLGVNIFKTAYEVFETRFVNLRDKVPQGVRDQWDKDAEAYAQIGVLLENGDTRPVKDYLIKSGMEFNKQALSNPQNTEARVLGRSLYEVGRRMQVSVGKTR